MDTKEIVKELVGRTIEYGNYPVHKIKAVICWGKPKNNFDSFLTYAICKTDRGFIQLSYEQFHRGCGDYVWRPSYPYEVKEKDIKAHIMNDCYGGWDNGQGDPVWVDETYNK